MTAASRRLAPVALVLASIVLGSCSDTATPDQGRDASLPPLLTAEELGDGWVEFETAPVPLSPAAVAPPCPFTSERPEIEVTDAASVELGNDAAELGVVHTVVDLGGDDTAVEAVLAAWASMHCEGSDFDQSDLDGFGDDVVAVALAAQRGPLVQVVTAEPSGSTMSFLVVSGNGEGAIDLARALHD